MASATAAAARRSHWVGNQRKWPHETGGSAPGERAEAGWPRSHTLTHSQPGARALTLAQALPAPHPEGETVPVLLKIRSRSPPAHQQREQSLSHIALDHVSFKFSCSPNPCNSEAGDISLGSKGILEGQWKRRGVPYAV